MTSLDLTVLGQLIQPRQTTFTPTELSVIFKYATDLSASDSYGGGVGRAIITELADSSEDAQATDEVFRRLGDILDDVNVFYRIFDSIQSGHLGVEKLEEVNQILTRLNAERLELADKHGLLALDDPNYVIVNTANGYYVLPGEEPRAFESLDSVAEEIACLVDEYGHVLGTTLQVYQLTLVPAQQLTDRVAIKLSELKARNEQLDRVIDSLEED